jgi:YD repeat-containing protein
MNDLGPTCEGTPQVTSYGYDDAGNLHTVGQSDGLTTTYTYDALNRLDLEEVRPTGGGSIVASYDYHVRGDGLRDWVVEHQQDANASTFNDVKVSWTYNNLGRLTGEFRDDYSGGGSPSTGGSPNSAADYKESFDYDLVGKRVKRVHEKQGTSPT